MERAEWLKKMRLQSEAVYDHLAPAFWRTFGLYPNETHRQFIKKFLERLGPHSSILDAACGAGRYDGMLLKAGHSVLGIDQSASMLAEAREHFPEDQFPGLRYQKMGLQEIDFQEQFDGLTCIDALEHIPPEDWPGILARFRRALKSGGVLYVTVEAAEGEENVAGAYERARAQGLPVVPGEIVDKADTASVEVLARDWHDLSGEQADGAVYHYLPALEQARLWFDGAGLTIEEEGSGKWYTHLLATKRA